MHEYHDNRYLDVGAKPGPTLEVDVEPSNFECPAFLSSREVQLSQLSAMTAPISTWQALSS